LSCVYCIPQHSSKINAELKKFGPDLVGQKYLTIEKDRNIYHQKFFEWLTVNGDKLMRLSVLGGEPLLQKEFWELLEQLTTERHPNLELTINSNLNCDQQTIERFVNLAHTLVKDRRLKRIDIGCSLDCWGKPAEFVRHGLDLNNWQRNFEFLINHKWLYITVHHVITALTIKTAIDLQRKITEYKKKNKSIVQAYHFLDGPTTEVYHPGIFGYDFFKNDIDQLLQEYPETQHWDKTAKGRLIGVAKMLQSSKIDIPRLKKLQETLDMIDVRRNTNWKNVFPEIAQFFKEHNI